MDIAQFIAQFFYRIRYWLLWGTLFVTGLVIYFTRFLPYSYTVEGSLFAGVTNATSIDGTTVNISSINSTFDNLIGLAKSQGTLSNVSVRLLANALTYGEEWHDNRYIEAKHYRQLLSTVPPEVLALVDRKDVQKTTDRLFAYRKEEKNNYIYALFAGNAPYYSFKALNQVDVKRSGISDILNITYTSADPGMTQQTVIILIEELKKAYEILRFKATNDVIAYFKEQVRIAKIRMNEEEDKLMHYCVQERVINYTEETEALSITRYEVDDRKELAMRKYESARALLEMLEEKMDIRAKIIRDNTQLLNELNRVSELNQDIIEQEVFTKSPEKSEKLKRDKASLKKVEDRISHISDNLIDYNFSKEGVGIDDMVSEWLQALVDEARYSAELKVLRDRQQDIFDQYSHMSPIGTQVARMQRAIGIAEDNYRTQLKGLADANLRLKNIEMTTSNLRTVAPPVYPLTDNGRKRFIYVLVAFIGSMALITIYFLLIEVLDRTLRDSYRSRRLTGLPVISAFNGISNLKYRGFLKACNRIAAAYSCRRLNKYLKTGEEPTVINLLSMNAREGKSFLAKYFVNYWQEEGLHVRIVTHDVDFDSTDKCYVQARHLGDFWIPNEAEQRPDIILVEYPPIKDASIPLPVLREADVTLLVANACRLWHDSDTVVLAPVKETLQGTPFMLYLNNADREVVETFTGQLPPHTPVRTFFNRLAHLGLTSQQNAVK